MIPGVMGILVLSFFALQKTLYQKGTNQSGGEQGARMENCEEFLYNFINFFEFERLNFLLLLKYKHLIIINNQYL